MSLRMEVNVLRFWTDRVHAYHEDVVYVTPAYEAI